jgi:hypothetical protein
MFEAVAYHDGACRSAAFFARKGGGVVMPRIYTLLAALAAIGFAAVMGGAPYGP